MATVRRPVSSGATTQKYEVDERWLELVLAVENHPPVSFGHFDLLAYVGLGLGALGLSLAQDREDRGVEIDLVRRQGAIEAPCSTSSSIRPCRRACGGSRSSTAPHRP